MKKGLERQLLEKKIDPQTLETLKKMSLKIYEETRSQWTGKEKPITSTEVYRKMCYEILEKEGVINIIDLFEIIRDSGRIRDDVLLAFFIHNIIMDPNPSKNLIIFQWANRTYVAFSESIKDLLPIIAGRQTN